MSNCLKKSELPKIKCFLDKVQRNELLKLGDGDRIESNLEPDSPEWKKIQATNQKRCQFSKIIKY
jgi:hypothetical protein